MAIPWYRGIFIKGYHTVWISYRPMPKHMYIWVQISKVGQKFQVILFVKIFRHVHEDFYVQCASSSKAQCIQVLLVAS